MAYSVEQIADGVGSKYTMGQNCPVTAPTIKKILILPSAVMAASDIFDIYRTYAFVILNLVQDLGTVKKG